MATAARTSQAGSQPFAMLPTRATTPDSSSSLDPESRRDDDSRSRRSEPDPFGLEGVVIDGRYLVDRAVAEGGYGVVYRGHHVGLDVAVAIKLLKLRPDRGDATTAEMIAGFLQEAHAVARLRHANIVSVLDAGEHPCPSVGRDVPYIVFEWLDGPTLAADLQARRGRGGRKLQEALALWRPICEAIGFAHQAGIAHRDLKPKNIIVQGTPRRPLPKVLDFGIAKSLEMVREAPDSTETDSGRRAFSPDHAAPEQLAGTRTGPWTDVHALGLLLVELLVDAAPYGDEPAERYTRAFSRERPTPKYFGIDLGPIELVLDRALCLKPRERYAQAIDLLIAMDDAVAKHAADVAARSTLSCEPVRAAPSPAVNEEEGMPSESSDSGPSHPSAGHRATVSSSSLRSRLRALALPGLGAAAAVGALAGWWLGTVRTSASLVGPSTEPSLDVPRRLTAFASTDSSGATSRHPVAAASAPRDFQPHHRVPLPVKTPSPGPPSGLGRSVARTEPRPGRSTAGQSEFAAPIPSSSSTAAASSPVVTTPGVPAPYRLE